MANCSPPMTVVEDTLAAFRRGEIGRSVASVRLAGETVSAVTATLTQAGFHYRREPLAAERTAGGAPMYRRADGTAATDPNDPNVVPVDVFVHADGGFVKVFPVGDPRRRVVPVAGAPVAIKGVLFQRPSFGRNATGAPEVDVDTTFLNEAFRVTDGGEPLPKSRRAIYGLGYNPKSMLESYEFAEGVVAETVLLLASPNAAPGAPPRGAGP